MVPEAGWKYIATKGRKTMKAMVLNGAHEHDPIGERVVSSVLAELEGRGWEVEHAVLREKKIANCQGDFFCWTRSPGLCMIDDDNRRLAASIVQSDLLVYLTPVTFGGYSSYLKKAVDHQIQNILPFFAKVNGETHHAKRYADYPAICAVGWADTPDVARDSVFHHLVWRNALNMYAGSFTSGVVTAVDSDRVLRDKVRALVEQARGGATQKRVELPFMPAPEDTSVSIKQALFLVGSPRRAKSTSNSLGSYLMAKLEASGIKTETVYVYDMLGTDDKKAALIDAVKRADLIVLAFPLYVDSLPAPVIACLETIAAASFTGLEAKFFVPLVNCGFPEAAHNNPALAVCREFSRETGFIWAGSLSLGSGEGLVRGVPLDKLGGPAMLIMKVLDEAGKRLASGLTIPTSLQKNWDKPVIPGWLYRTIGAFGWRAMAKQWKAEKRLKARPYENSLA